MLVRYGFDIDIQLSAQPTTLITVAMDVHRGASA